MNLTPLPRHANPDAAEAYSRINDSDVIMLRTLKNGRVAVFARDFRLYGFLEPDAFTFDIDTLAPDLALQMKLTSKLGAEARFYGEPDSKTLASDLRTIRQPVRESRTILETFDLK